MSDAKPQIKRIVLAVTLAEQGGVQEFLLKFARYLQEQRQYEVTLLMGEGDWLPEQAKQHGLNIFQVKHLRRAIHPYHDLLALLKLRRILKQLQPDAIHLNSTKMGVLGSLAAQSVKIKQVVYRIGGWVFLEPLPPLTKWMYQWIERKSAHWKDIIICVHPEDKKLAEDLKIVPRNKIVVVPNGINLRQFDETLLSPAKARLALELEALPKNAFVFGTIANFFPAKDLPRYLDACALVSKQFPQARFVMIGDGEGRKTLETKISTLGLNRSVFLLGEKSSAHQYLRAFDAFVLPSAKEGMSWALLEAMAARLPCIATNVGANEWLLRPTAGWLVPPHSPQQLAERLKEVLIRPDEAKRRGEQARQRIEQDFPLEKTLEENKKTLTT